MQTTDTETRAEPALAGSPSSDASAAQGLGTGLIGGCLTQHRQLQYEVSRYIELLLGELLTMARAADLGALQHSLETTRQDAAEQTRIARPRAQAGR